MHRSGIVCLFFGEHDIYQSLLVERRKRNVREKGTYAKRHHILQRKKQSSKIIERAKRKGSPSIDKRRAKSTVTNSGAGGVGSTRRAARGNQSLWLNLCHRNWLHWCRSRCKPFFFGREFLRLRRKLLFFFDFLHNFSSCSRDGDSTAVLSEAISFLSPSLTNQRSWASFARYYC